MVTAEMILEAAATEFKTTVAKIVGPGRVRSLVEARAYVALWLRVWCHIEGHTPMSYPAIGRAIGGRDHSTVMYLCGKLADRQPHWLKAGNP